MDIAEVYETLYQESRQKFLAGNYQIDARIDDPLDTRRGLTLILRPDASVGESVQRFLRDLQNIEPRQYCYPESDVHITVMPIISCVEGFTLSSLPIDRYIQRIDAALRGISPFCIDFSGITASPSCILVQGFPRDSSLKKIRDLVRTAFTAGNIHQTLEQRYPMRTAHATVCRLKEKLKDKSAFSRFLDAHRHREFGTFMVKELELVFNDWYLRKEHLQVLHRFSLYPEK